MVTSSVAVSLLFSFWILSIHVRELECFVSPNPVGRQVSSPLLLLKASTSTPEAPATSTGKDGDDDDVADNDLFEQRGLLKRDRYVATNRFAVRKGRAAKFEQRWANRKSRLATLDGFQYFHLMRRVTLNDGDDKDEDKTITSYDEGDDNDSAFGNYVSFTIWNQKSHFTAWRKSDAFIEAHGGTSIANFLGAMMNSAMVLRGAPRPAFYDGLLLQSTVPTDLPATAGGWRTGVEADGIQTLPTECFVACNQFFVPPGENAIAFERRWAQRESKLKECDGFIAFFMLRRDVTVKSNHASSSLGTDEPSYQSTTIWKDRASFVKWRASQAFSKVHGTDKKKEGDSNNTKTQPQWTKPPQPVFYEGTLVITSKDGA